MKVICQICQEHIANTGELSLPLKGSMFLSPDLVHDFPAPFDPGDTWETMRCPYGRIYLENGQQGGHRPFLKDHEVLTEEGLITVTGDGAKPPISDEEAENLVRTGLKQGKTINIIVQEAQAAPVFKCEICGKGFPSRVKMTGHVSGAHKQRKK